MQKCHSRQNNMRAEGWGPGSYNRAGGRGPNKSNSRTFVVICFSRLYVTVYYKKWTDLLRSLLWIFTEYGTQGAEGAKVDNSRDKLWPMPYDRVAYLVSKSTCWICWKNWSAHILQNGIHRPVTLELKKWKTCAFFKSQ